MGLERGHRVVDHGDELLLADVHAPVCGEHVLAGVGLRATGPGASDMPKVEQRVIEFFCAGAGGPETYTGKDMLATHKGMNVSEQEFVTVIDDAMAALETHNIDPATRNDVLAILWSLKGEVIRV